MPGPAFLYGEGVELRTVEAEDLDFLQENRNDPRVRKRFPSPRPLNREAVEAEFEERSTDDDVRLLVVPAGGDDPVGFVALFDLDGVHGTAQLGYWVAPDHWGEGYATAAAATAVDHAFRERRLERVEANALATNAPSRAVIENLGFTEEGRERAAMVAEGERVDRVNYGLLREEWAVRQADPNADEEVRR